MTNDTTNCGAQAVARAQEQTDQALEALRDELAREESVTLLSAVFQTLREAHRQSLRLTLLTVSWMASATRVAVFWGWRMLRRSVCNGKQGIVDKANAARDCIHFHDGDA